ncbi:MAG: FkbM family methyltransferase [Proteobacteria bacterium]|nr:FkbM family methyltransferase [Pseudomonadota bacterium]
MSLHGGYRLLASDQDLTGGAILMPLQILRELVGRPDAVIFDVGASSGHSVERFLSVFERAIIHSFEPQTAAFSTLHHRFGAHPGVRVNNVALADRIGIADLHRGSYHEASSLLAFAPDSWWGKSQNVSADGTITVALDTIDHYCAEHAVTTIDLLKLDVQGAEPECLRGAQAMLAAGAVRVVQVEIILHGIYERRGSFAAIEALLAPHGFHLVTLFDVTIAPRGEILQLDAVYARE